MKQFDDGSILVGPARLSYLNVFKARQNQQGKMEFSVTLMIPKTANEFCPANEAEIAAVKTAFRNAATAKFADRAKGCKIAFKDGDAPGDDGEPKFPGYWYLRCAAGADYPPLLIDGKRKPVTAGWKSGDWAMAKLRLWSYDRPDSRGVSAGLMGLQFLYQDESLGGGGSASANDFDEVANAHSASAPAPDASDDFDPFEDE